MIRFLNATESRSFIVACAKTATMTTIEQGRIKDLEILCPPLPEQKTIVAFLDRETAKIDRLMEVRRKQMERLQEQRTAVIHHAVTKGLDPLAEMKPSGVEWFGEVPETWTVWRLKHVCSCLDGKRVPLNATERGLIQGEIPYWGANAIQDDVNDFLFDEELVLLGEDGAPFGDQTKNVAFYINGKIWPNNHIHVLKPASRVDAMFLTHVLNITDYIEFLDGATRAKLTQGKMGEIPVPLPSLPVQNEIVAHLERETVKHDTLISKYRRELSLLLEYRASLISHAVTGKIDVRGLVPLAQPQGVEAA